MSNTNTMPERSVPYLEVEGPPLPPPRDNFGCENSSPRPSPNSEPNQIPSADHVPDDESCFRCWNKYAMPDNIREHSLMVARAAELMAIHAQEAGRKVCVKSVRASALLHDIAKAYSIDYGGSHAQLGGAWALEYTGNPQIAQGVLHHVYWPFDMDPEHWFLPLAVLYADKRVRHNSVVTVEDRYEDLFARYGRNEEIRAKMHFGRAQALAVQDALGRYLGVELNESTFSGRRLVD